MLFDLLKIGIRRLTALQQKAAHKLLLLRKLKVTATNLTV